MSQFSGNIVFILQIKVTFVLHLQIGHNVEIGKFCMLCGQVGIAGSATYVAFFLLLCFLHQKSLSLDIV